MAIKLRQLYDSVKDQEITLLAGENGLDNVVRWVHMVETIKLSVFLEGQEVAFTTGLGLEKEGELFELVKHTFDNNASGMIINVGPFIKKIPDEIIEFCNENNFPLFQVPWHIYMAEIIRKFCYEITVSDRVNMELSSAIKNAIFFQDQEELYVPQLERYNFKANWSYCVSIIQIVKQNNKKIKDKERLKTILKCIENRITHDCNNTFVFQGDYKFILVFAKYSEDKIKSIIEKIKKDCMMLLNDTEKMYCCVGESTKNVKCIGKSYKKALSVLKLQKKREDFNDIAFYRDLGIYKLLLSMEDKEIIKEYYKETIEPLINYDDLNGTDYVLVLEKYLKCNGSVKEVASQMFVHRNTINYKLKKIEEILSCDLSNLNTRLVYSIALMLKEIM